ncbi:MAG: PaaI family thioesterase [Bdellovibrionaceae bacterium]|nr:PaaI family thioesterase [Pseudobdellovibrionaceae bacterium]
MAKCKDFRGHEEALKQSFQNGLSQTLGVEFLTAYEDGLEVKVEVSDRHSRPGGIANGGLALALLETVGSISAYAQIDGATSTAMGVSVSMNHLKAIRIGETITARSKAVHIGRSTQVWDVEVRNSSAELTSSGRITMIVIARKA